MFFFQSEIRVSVDAREKMEVEIAELKEKLRRQSDEHSRLMKFERERCVRLSEDLKESKSESVALMIKQQKNSKRFGDELVLTDI